MIPFIESAKDEILAKIDTLKTTIDRLISSSQGNNPNIALGNLSNKIDALKQNVDTKSSQTTVNKVGQDLNNIASTITSKIGTVETKVNQTNTTLATKANQNTVDAVANTANQINTALASKASQASVNGISNNVNSVLELAKKGVVKSVQRGMLMRGDIYWNELPKSQTATGSRIYYTDITIPYAVKIEKSFLLVNIGGIAYKHDNEPYFAYQLINTNTIRILEPVDAGTSWSEPIITWQVIEYY